MPPSAHSLQQALAAYQAGDFAQTERLSLQALRHAPEHPDALYLLGLAAARGERHGQAADFFARALRGAPHNATLHGHLGIVLRQLGRHDDALQSFARAIALNPDSAPTHNNHGNTLADLKRHNEAIGSFERAIALAPDYAEAWYNLGNSQSALHDADRAITSLRKAIAIDPEFVDAYNNLGVALAERNRHEEAVACYQRALDVDPQFADALNNLGVALADLKRYDAAMSAYERAIVVAPDYADAHWNLALCRLLLGDFARGWQGYEWRWRQEQVARFQREYPQPLWRGAEPLAGKTMLLYAEQGLGDMLQFCRYAQKVTALGATVLLETPAALHAVLSTLEGVAQVVPQGAPAPRFDLHCPITSLPLAFRTDLQNIPAAVPYIRSDPARVAAWREKLGGKTKPRVGLAWSGNLLPDPNRSMTLREALPLVFEWADCISLQKEVRAADAPLLAASGNLRHFGDHITDFADTAALIDLSDLVISIDTSVAHLAGAMGKPLWVMLPYNPDWRWMVGRSDSPWYPSARLFRQSAIANWSNVIVDVRDALLERFQR